MADTELNHGLSGHSVAALIEVFKAFPLIHSVILYGSRAKGNYHEGSDIDFAVSAPDMSDAAFSMLWNALDNLPIIYKIDCLHLEKLKNQSLKDNIMMQGVIFFKS